MIVALGHWVLAILLSLPAMVLGLECVMALTTQRKARGQHPPAPPFVLIMRARNAQGHIAATIRAARAQLRPCDQLLVIADNCTDDTATMAQAAGATVVARQDFRHADKADGWQFGRKILQPAPPQLIVLMEAGQVPFPGAIQQLAAAAAINGCATLAPLLCVPDHAAGPQTRVAAFSCLMHRQILQTGLQRLAGIAAPAEGPVALPWAVFDRMPLGAEGLTRHALRCERDAAFVEHDRARARGQMAGAVTPALRHIPMPRHLMPSIRSALGLSAIGLGVFAGAAMITDDAAPAMLFAGAQLWLLLGLWAVWIRWGRDLLPLRMVFPGLVYRPDNTSPLSDLVPQ